MQHVLNMAKAVPGRLLPCMQALATASFLGMAMYAGTAQASVVFSDSTYNPLDYSDAFVYNNNGTSMFSATPGSGLQFNMVTNGPEGAPSVLHGVLNTTFVYNPAIEGAIGSISASSTKTFTVTNPDPTNRGIKYNNFFRPLVEQDGKYYAAGIMGTPLGTVMGGGSGTVGPETIAQSGLTANDFFLVDTANGVLLNMHGLNFSGDPLTFGVVQLFASAGTLDTGMTNYADLKITVAPVPLPGAAPMLGAALLALGTIGYGLKRKAGSVGV